jgi:hypothetical protein
VGAPRLRVQPLVQNLNAEPTCEESRGGREELARALHVLVTAVLFQVMDIVS